MTVIKYTDECQLGGGRVCAIGFFDGVHIGHRALFTTAKRRARELSLPFSVFTFFSENENIKKGNRLYSTEEKLALIEGFGADEVILADFELLRGLTPEQFVNDLLIQKLNTVCAVTGNDFKFGCGATGRVCDLERMMSEAKREVITVDDVELFGRKVSTTEIKGMLISADVKGANEMLGSEYHVSGTVEHGNGVGSSLGFPTVNLAYGKNEILKRGVYRTEALIDGVRYPSITNVGTCPTLGERAPHTETYILDFDKDIYGKAVTVYFLEFMREEMTFASKEELTRQISKDINRAKKEFSNNGRKLD